jgi:hypothetical protein
MGWKFQRALAMMAMGAAAYLAIVAAWWITLRL